jgi:four helix bundle protein
VERRRGNDIVERILDAVEAVRRMLRALHRDAAAKHVASQLWRALTSGGANYEEARGAESRADFMHKLGVATKELREAHYWLRVVQRSDRVQTGTVDPLLAELDQLVAILTASIRTAKANHRQGAGRRSKFPVPGSRFPVRLLFPPRYSVSSLGGIVAIVALAPGPALLSSSSRAPSISRWVVDTLTRSTPSTMHVMNSNSPAAHVSR